MDRNPSSYTDPINLSEVALRKESVDRNKLEENIHRAKNVALRKESVDRNILPSDYIMRLYRSLSARRAWIEILVAFKGFEIQAVALRKESVDRNFCREV